MIVSQYYYDVNETTLSTSVLLQVAARKVSDILVRIYVRKDEVLGDDDFKGLDVVMLTKGLQPKHFQIELIRRPKILQVKRVAI